MNDVQPWLNGLFGCEGRRVLVTGASRGIGREIALGFARAGAHLLITSRTLAALADTQRDISALGASVECVAFDQRDTEQVKLQLAGVEPVDVLINNAGVEEVRRSVDVDEALWDKIVDTNLRGAFFVAQAAAAGMMKRGAGSIINLASLTSYVGVPGAVPYGSSKSGILGMTRALAVEWAPHGIRVNAIAPGYFLTDLTRSFYDNKAWVAAMTQSVPMRRLGELDDLVGAALFLAGRGSAYITGQCLAIDGGYLASI